MVRKQWIAFLPLLLIATALICSTGARTAWAFEVGEEQVRAFDTTAGDGTVHIVNRNFSTVTEDSNGNSSGGLLCAMIYVYDAHEELEECCGCPVTNHGLRTLSVHTDLTSNPANGQALTTGEIEIITALQNHPFISNRSAQQVCNPALSYTLATDLSTSMVEAVSNGSFSGVTDVNFLDNLVTDFTSDISLCSTVIHQNGSGAGRCSCGTGDDEAAIPTHAKHR